MSLYIQDRNREAARPERIREAWAILEPTFGAMFPGDITKATCRGYIDHRSTTVGRRGRTAGPSTIHNELAVLRAGLHWAEKHRLVSKAPAIFLPSKPPPRERHLTREEVDRLLAATVRPHVKLFIILALHTAGRHTAILDLTWDRVDFARRLIDLNPTGARQTKKGRATVPINDTLLEALQEAARGRISDYVVEWGGKRCLRLTKGFANACQRAGIEDASPHVLRHTAAVWMAEAGVPMGAIAAYLGHRDSRTTEAVYIKFSPDYLRRASGALERA